MALAKFSHSFFKRKNTLSFYTIYLKKKLTTQDELLFARPVSKETIQAIYLSRSNFQTKLIMSSSCDSTEKGIKIKSLQCPLTWYFYQCSFLHKAKTELRWSPWKRHTYISEAKHFYLVALLNHTDLKATRIGIV